MEQEADEKIARWRMIKLKKGANNLIIEPKDEISRKTISAIYDRNHAGLIEFEAQCAEGKLICRFKKDPYKLNDITQFRKNVKTRTKEGKPMIHVYVAKQDKNKPSYDRRIVLHIGDNKFLLSMRDARRIAWHIHERVYDKELATRRHWPPIKECVKCGHVYKPWEDDKDGQ